ncbi:PAS domain S-box protein [Lacrimispora sp.]|uniref:PAS domain S-box protein n=1 Tax=Lacrimispora sp. TaxID=2719234 RepID=UPI0028A9FF10|nr:PAS domain S-box protein [Lacrimispora sp.]
MDEMFFESIVKNSPMAYAYHKIILNEEGTPCDYIFLDVNSAFEEMSGMKRENMIGKKVTEAMPDIQGDSFDWIKVYGKVALNGGMEEYERYSEVLDRWYRVYVYSPEPYYFVVNFMDISKERKQVEERDQLMEILRERDLEFHFIIENLPFCLGMVQLDGTFLYINPSGQALYELEEATYYGQSIIPYWEESKEWIRFVEAVKVTGLIRDYEMNLKMPSGKVFWAIGIGMLFQYQGKVCILLAQYDITQRRQAEKALMESEEKFRSIFEYASESILIVQNSRIQINNPMFSNLLGYSKEELFDKPFLELVHEEDRPKAKEVYYERLSGEEPEKRPQYRVVCKDGSIVWVEVNGVRAKWLDKPAIEYFLVDITEQKKVEDALRASEERLRMIMGFSSDVTWIFNFDQLKLTYVSPSIFHFLGYHPEELMKMNPVDLVPNEFRLKTKQILIQNIKEFMAKPEESNTYTIELQNIHKDGKRIWTEMSSKNRYNDKMEVEIVSSSRNIEERKHAQQEVLYLSYHDQLTGLYNRRYYEEELRRMDTKNNLPITMILADVNGLKLTNDAFGHMTGDLLLKRTVEIFHQNSRCGDIIARIGGDEFVFLLSRTNKEEAEEMISRMKAAMAKEKVENGILSVSFGSATKTMADQDIYYIFSEAENAMYQQKLKESISMRNQTIQIITDTLFRDNQEEEVHNRRVSELCKELAIAMELGEDMIHHVTVAGFYHDIGKIGLDKHIISKMEPMTEEEWIQFRRHPEKGYQILKSSAEFAQAAQYVLSHHERMDGNGYPQGISGEDIPLPARILSVADAYDTMRNPRGYHEKWSQEDAVRELLKNAGTQFDEAVVRIFVDMVLRQSLEGFK